MVANSAVSAIIFGVIAAATKNVSRSRLVHRTSAMPEWLDYPVKTRADWDKLKAERYCIGDTSRVAEDWPAFRQKIVKSGAAMQDSSDRFLITG